MEMGLHRLGIASCIVVTLLCMFKVVLVESYESANDQVASTEKVESAADILSYVDIEDRHAYKFIYSPLLQKTAAEDDDVLETEEGSTQTQNTNSRQIEIRPHQNVTWPHATLPYKIDFPSYKDGSKVYAVVMQAINIWSQSTCVKFVNIDAREHADWRLVLGHGNYVNIVNKYACMSSIGRSTLGSKEGSGQILSLNERKCLNVGTVLHELGHALGLVHEQSRMDRDEYVQINKGNINSKYEHNFAVLDTQDLAKYDYNSIMHYGIKAFSTSHGDSISLKDANLKFLAGQREQLTFYDIKAINLAYRCNARCTTEQECENDGYLGPDCHCVCPHTLGGIACTDISSEWQDKGCGSGVTNLYENDTVEITSPNYPLGYGHGKCAWLVKGPSGQNMSISVLVDDIPRDRRTHKCYHNIEIRYNLLGQRGISFCGSSVFPYRVESAGDSVLIILHADNEKYAGKNFKIELGSGNKKKACVSKVCPEYGSQCVEDPSGVARCACMDNFREPTCSALKFIICTFDLDEGPYDFCLFSQNQDDDLDWRQKSFSTASRGTGPVSDMSGHGMYLYMESSGPASSGDIAVLNSYLIASGEKCFSLFYNMYGNTMGEFIVRITPESNPEWTHTWLKAGDQGPGWKHVLFSISSTIDFKIHIAAVRGRSFRSDIAIDAVSLTNELCYPVVNTTITHINIPPVSGIDCPLFYTGPNCELIYVADCSFDTDNINDLCVFTNSTYKSYWQKEKHSDLVMLTGPSDDVSRNGYFLYIEAPHRNSYRLNATLVSDYIQGGTVCITFQLYMYGNINGTIYVQFEDNSGHKNFVEEYSGADKWDLHVYEITSADKFKMKILPVQGKAGFDDFNLSRGNCSLKVDTFMTLN